MLVPPFEYLTSTARAVGWQRDSMIYIRRAGYQQDQPDLDSL